MGRSYPAITASISLLPLLICAMPADLIGRRTKQVNWASTFSIICLLHRQQGACDWSILFVGSICVEPDKAVGGTNTQTKDANADKRVHPKERQKGEVSSSHRRSGDRPGTEITKRHRVLHDTTRRRVVRLHRRQVARAWLYTWSKNYLPTAGEMCFHLNNLTVCM
jgi:hypothetical protein